MSLGERLISWWLAECSLHRVKERQILMFTCHITQDEPLSAKMQLTILQFMTLSSLATMLSRRVGLHSFRLFVILYSALLRFRTAQRHWIYVTGLVDAMRILIIVYDC